MQPSSWKQARLGAVRSRCIRSTFGSVDVSAAREPFAEVMGRPRPRGAVLRVRGRVRRTGERFAIAHERHSQRVLTLGGDTAIEQTNK